MKWLIISMFHGVRGVPREKMERLACVCRHWQAFVRRRVVSDRPREDGIVHGYLVGGTTCCIFFIISFWYSATTLIKRRDS